MLFLHTLSPQNRDGPSIRSSHPEHMTLVRYSSTILTLPLNLFFNSRYNPFTGPDAWPRELLENRPSPKATTVAGSSAVIRRQSVLYAFVRSIWVFHRSRRHRGAPWNSRNASRWVRIYVRYCWKPATSVQQGVRTPVKDH
jgi:hypothetical protein